MFLRKVILSTDRQHSYFAGLNIQVNTPTSKQPATMISAQKNKIKSLKTPIGGTLGSAIKNPSVIYIPIATTINIATPIPIPLPEILSVRDISSFLLFELSIAEI